LINYNEYKEVLRLAASENFVAFCYYYDFDFFTSRPFLKQIAKAFQDVADGKIKKMSVSLPPRAGKSYITSLYCAWILGRHPSESVMRNTCTATLAMKLSYDAREIVRSEKFQAVFPEVKISQDKGAVGGWNTNKARQVSYFGAGVGGTIIGFGATKVAITDDLFKSMEEAMSETIREKTWSWKQATHDSRMESGCAQIDIGTRWTRDDVIGKNTEDGIYEVQIIVPALDENGNSFCEAVMTTAEYLDKKSRMIEEIWSAEYMQNPIDIKGRLFENLKMFDDLDFVTKNSEGALAYIDVADEGSDFLCLVVAHIVGGSVYVTSALYSKANTDVTIPLCAEMLTRNKVKMCRVETNGMGAIFLKTLQKDVPSVTLIGVSNHAAKETRIIMNAPFVLNKFYFHNSLDPNYLLGLKSFQKEGRNKHDDAPDATTGLALFVRGMFSHLDT
jgi:predicted phage terminase large subunit-like protein